MFFKGLTADRSSEARVTMTLSSVAPDVFARTRALTTRPDGAVWWLAEACAGVPFNAAAAPGRFERVAAACARVQQEIMVTAIPYTADCYRVDLPAIESWGSEMLSHGAVGGELRDGRAAIARAFDDLDAAHAPSSWVPMDLDPANVLIDERDTVRFIDLDDSCQTAAPLAIATFGRRVKQLRGALASDSVRALYRAYERSWTHTPLEACQWSSIEVVSGVLEAHLGWRRAMASFMSGELHGPVDVLATRVARRLSWTLRPT